MSKINRRKEIQEKEQLQAKFQLAISNTNSKVSNWLKPLAQSEEQNEADNSSFLNLPIIPAGEGLYSLQNDNHNKISDFMNSQQAGLRKLKESSDNPPASKAMKALLNKVKNSREKTRNASSNSNNSHHIKSHQNALLQSAFPTKHSKNGLQLKNKPHQLSQTQVSSDSDSDEDMSIFKKRSVKKGANILPSKIGKKRSNRPF